MAKRQTKTEHLQTLWDSIPYLMEATIEFKGIAGWWVTPEQQRWWGDNGDYAGRNFQEAEAYIRSLAPKGTK